MKARVALEKYPMDEIYDSCVDHRRESGRRVAAPRDIVEGRAWRCEFRNAMFGMLLRISNRLSEPPVQRCG